MAGLFVNYRTGDGDWAAALIASRLSARFGKKNVFFASRSIRLGEDFAKQILSYVPKCDALLAIIGPAWSTARDSKGRRKIEDRDDWVRREIALAFEHGVRVIPILLDKVACLRESDLPQEIVPLARCQYLRLDHRNDYYDTARLIRELSDLVLEQEPQSPLVITVPTTNQPDGGAWVVDSAISQVPRPDELGWSEWRQWTHANGSPVSPESHLSVRVEGVDRQAVILERMRFHVVNRAVPGEVVLTVAERSAYRSALEPRRFSIDLVSGAAGIPHPAPGSGTDFPYTVSQNDPEWFLVDLDVGSTDVEWTAELDWSCAGRTGSLRIDRGGEPFRTVTPHRRLFYSWNTQATPNYWAPQNRPFRRELT